MNIEKLLHPEINTVYESFPDINELAEPLRLSDHKAFRLILKERQERFKTETPQPLLTDTVIEEQVITHAKAPDHAIAIRIYRPTKALTKLEFHKRCKANQSKQHNAQQ